MLYLNFEKENLYHCKTSRAQISMFLFYINEVDLYLVSKSLGH